MYCTFWVYSYIIYTKAIDRNISTSQQKEYKVGVVESELSLVPSGLELLSFVHIYVF